MKKRKRWMAVLLAAVLAFSFCACAKQGQNGEDGKKGADGQQKEEQEKQEEQKVKIDKDITMYVHVKAGGALDVRARVIAEYLSKELGVNVTVLNVTGSGGATCMTQMQTSPTSEYDLAFAASSVFTATPAFTEVAYSLDDFTPLAAVDVEQFGLFTCPERSGIEDFEGLVEYAKSNEVIYGSGGVGNITHLTQAYLYHTLGMTANTLAHDGAVEGITNCMGGHNIVTMAGLETARGYVESGDVTPILNFTDEEYTGYEGYTVPSIKEAGANDDNVYESLMAIYCLSSVDEVHAKVLRDALLEVLKNPDCQADLVEVGLIETPEMTTEEMKQYLQKEYETMKKVVEMLQ